MAPGKRPTDHLPRSGHKKRRRKGSFRRDDAIPYRIKDRPFQQSLNAAAMTNPLLSTAFPDQKVVKMRYCQSVKLDPGAGVIATQVFSANGLYDVDITGTGHQPMGFDQYAAFYNNYRVIGAKLQAQLTPTTGNNEAPTVVGIYLDDDATPDYATYTSYVESGRATYMLLDPNMRDTDVLIGKFSAKQYFGLATHDDIDYSGSFSANPAKTANFVLFAQSADLATNAYPVTFLVTIDYIVKLMEPKGLTAS